jgi:hypothetical protein
MFIMRSLTEQDFNFPGSYFPACPGWFPDGDQIHIKSISNSRIIEFNLDLVLSWYMHGKIFGKNFF